ncbi:MAG TPA: hypothetical protein VJH24_02435 [Candidatus Bilamarchaeaceae archaeon]|nr:hypothetical protein [Candidatus Bilamarchaeaceae archaeon]
MIGCRECDRKGVPQKDRRLARLQCLKMFGFTAAHEATRFIFLFNEGYGR